MDALRGPVWRTQDDRWEEFEVARLRQYLAAQRLAAGGRLPRIESDPRIALNVARLANRFPNARFIYQYRDVREALAVMLERWQSGKSPHASGVTLRAGQPWTGPLPPGWSRWTQRALPEVVAWQWASTTKAALDALACLPADRWCVTSFDRVLAETEYEHRRLRRFLGLRRVVALPKFAHAGEHSPDPRVWRPHADALTPEVLKLVAIQADRAVKLFAEPPRTRVVR